MRDTKVIKDIRCYSDTEDEGGSPKTHSNLEVIAWWLGRSFLDSVRPEKPRIPFNTTDMFTAGTLAFQQMMRL